MGRSFNFSSATSPFQFQVFMFCLSYWVLKNLVNSKFKGQKKFFWTMKNLYNSILKNVNNLLKKLVLLLLVQYAVTCKAIAVTDYHLLWCSVVINVIFNTCFGKSFVT
jgi:hypothetical protein